MYIFVVDLKIIVGIKFVCVFSFYKTQSFRIYSKYIINNKNSYAVNGSSSLYLTSA
jgi:hypothetical protein